MSRMKLLLASALASAFVFLGGAFTPVIAFADESVEGVETSEIVSVEEVVEETESVENSANDEVVEETEGKTKLSYEDILAITGELMKQEGFENKWDKAVYYMETAASEKKVEIMIALLIATLLSFVIYVVVKIVKNKIFNANILKIINSITGVETNGGAQTTAINGLIDEAEKVEGVATDSVRREKALANALGKQNIAIRCLIRGTNIKQDLKDEAFRSLNESDDLCDEAKK